MTPALAGAGARAPDQPICLGGRKSPSGPMPAILSSDRKRHFMVAKEIATASSPFAAMAYPQQWAIEPGMQQFPGRTSSP